MILNVSQMEKDIVNQKTLKNSNVGGAVVRCRTRDRKVAGLTPGLGQLSLPSLRGS